jgi:hypothetical protein
MPRLSRTTGRLCVALLAAVLVTVGLTAVTTGPASAEVKTFYPPKPRKYIKSTKVVAGKKNWYFEVKTKNAKHIKGLAIYIDDGETEHSHKGAEYLATWDPEGIHLYYLPEDALFPREEQDCKGLSVGKLSPPKGPAIYYQIPQRCLVIPDIVSTLNRLRVRVNVWAVVPDGGSGRKEGSWSPKPGKYRFHKFVANAPAAIEQFRR